MISVLDREENIMGKEEIARYQHFSFSLIIFFFFFFQNSSLIGSLNSGSYGNGLKYNFSVYIYRQL